MHNYNIFIILIIVFFHFARVYLFCHLYLNVIFTSTLLITDNETNLLFVISILSFNILCLLKSILIS